MLNICATQLIIMKELKNSVPDWAGDGLWEYLLVVNPDAGVNEKVQLEKKYFLDEYKEEIAVKTNPHITIANFLAKEEMEETLIRWIQRVCNSQEAFTTVLNNFSGFPAHTIYVRVQNAQPFNKLAKELKVIEHFIRSNNCPPARFISSPYMTIARWLPQAIYENAIQQYSRRLFQASFEVDQLVLVKRRHPYDKCKDVNVFRLPPKRNNLFN